MRAAFFDYLLQQAEIDSALYLLVGDVGFSLVEPFQQRFPSRYLNAGVAEQNMIGVAAGLAMMGKNVYVYSIIPFITLRCFEQIRNDICYQNLPVKIVGVGAGLSYGPMGATHHAIEDIAIMRSLPEMTIIAPGSVHEVRSLMPHINALKKPCYLRLGNNEELATYQEKNPISLSVPIILHDHEDSFIVATGNALDLAIKTRQILHQYGVDIGLASLPCIKPLNVASILAKKCAALFTIEEHSVIGGLGDALARTICENIDHKIIFQAFGINDFYFHEAGSRADLTAKAGLNAEYIAQTIAAKLAAYQQDVHTQPV